MIPATSTRGVVRGIPRPRLPATSSCGISRVRWNIIPIPRSEVGVLVTSFPATMTFPESTFCNPQILLSSVVLPEPFLPMIQTISPFSTMRLRFFSTLKSLKETFNSLISRAADIFTDPPSVQGFSVFPPLNARLCNRLVEWMQQPSQVGVQGGRMVWQLRHL